MSILKNLFCPISNQKVPEHLPRVTAFLSITLVASLITTGSNWILLFLVLDFLARGFNYTKYSPINYMARKISSFANLKSKSIDKAPKVFASKLGAFMFIIALIFNILGFHTISYTISLMVASLATLECIFNFCVGCYLYSLIVVPFYKKTY